ncbi:MAG: ABC transporter permease, partial [Alphaproteobacteria bacterium]|nr:ABC transporter permease [Alphaproteobacteria bacterium]
MTSDALAATGDRKLDTAALRHSRVAAVILIILAVITALIFAQADGDAVFRLSRPNDPWALPDLVVPAGPFTWIAAAVLAFLGVRQWLSKTGKGTALSLAIGFALVIAAFLVWATAGKAFSLTGMLQATMVRAVPIAMGGLAGVLCERVAVVNIGIEGILLAGAFTGALVGSLAGGWIGLVAAILVGGLFGFFLAAMVVTYRVDQIIAGVVINLFVLGLTSYVSSQVFSEFRFLNNAPVFRSIDIPLLSDIPVIGPVLFQQNIFVYGALIMVAVATYYLFHTKHGLQARAVGEHPQAADTLGINVYTVRYVHVTIGGMVAGFGGAF